MGVISGRPKSGLRTLTPCLNYDDSRSADTVTALRTEHDEHAVHQRTDNRLHTSYKTGEEQYEVSGRFLPAGEREQSCRSALSRLKSSNAVVWMPTVSAWLTTVTMTTSASYPVRLRP